MYIGLKNNTFSVPVWILDLKIRNTGRFGEIEAQLLSLAVPSVIESAVVKQT